MDLFPETKDFQPTNHVDLDRDVSLWDDYITARVKKITKEKPVSIVIAWNQKDIKKGYAYGSVIVKSTQSDTKFLIPIIIKDFKLAPLDVAMTPKGEVSLLNKDTVEDLLFDGSLATEAKEPPETNPMYENIVPSSTEWFNDSHVKTASIIANIWDTIDDSDWNRVQREMQEPEVMYKFAGEKTSFLQLFEHKLKKPKKEKKTVEAVKKIGVDSYIMMSNSIENFKPALDIVSNARVVQFMDENIPEDMRGTFVETMNNDGVVLDWSGKADGVHIVDDSQPEKVKKIEDSGFYRVKGPNGEVDGMFIKSVYQPIGDKISHTPVFISSQGGGPQQNKPKGIPISDYRLPISEPKVGDYGYFLYIHKNKPILVGPYHIKAISLDNYNDVYKELQQITAETETGTRVKICFSSYIDGFSVDADKKNMTMPRKDQAWIVCEKMWQIGKLKEEIMKSASVKLLKHDDHYEFRGFNELDNRLKYPNDDIEVSFVLRCCGAPLNKIAHIIDTAKQKGIVYMNIDLPQTQKKASYDLRFVEKTGLTKLASLFNDMTTVDAVLSLNFINNDNITKFTSALPRFEKVQKELLRLLIVSRLGNIEISENIIKQAIDIIDKVINGLHMLKARV